MISNNLISGEWFLTGIRALQDRTAVTQRQISSGFRVQDAADSPLEAADLIRLGTTLASVQHYASNLGRVGAEVSAADTALSAAIQLTDRARALAVRAASSTSTTADRQNIATEIKNIQQQLVAISNTSVEGRFIFGGDLDQTPPYQYDATGARGVDQLSVQSATRSFTDPGGSQIFLGETATNIFDHLDAAGNAAPDNVFAALQNLVSALNADDAAGAGSALTQLQAGADWLNQKEAVYGAAGKRIADETDAASTLITRLQTRISAIRDTDVAQAATDLAQENTAQSAAFSAQASVPRKSLFDYLG